MAYWMMGSMEEVSESEDSAASVAVSTAPRGSSVVSNEVGAGTILRLQGVARGLGVGKHELGRRARRKGRDPGRQLGIGAAREVAGCRDVGQGCQAVDIAKDQNTSRTVQNLAVVAESTDRKSVV